MYAVIVAPGREEQVKAAIEDFGDIVFFRAEIMDSGGIKEAFHSLARVAADVLVLDIEAGPGRDLVSAAKTYRIARPGVRIILLVPDREPGDVTVARMVGLGIYDVLAGEAESDWETLVREALQEPPGTFAQVARWHMTGDENEERTHGQVVIEKHPIGTVTISVAGAAPGLGCTHAALAVASHIAGRKYRVALLEFCERPQLDYLIRVLDLKPGELNGSYRTGNLIIYPLDVGLDVSERSRAFYSKLRQVRGKYDYLVIDLGVLNKAKMEEFSRAGLGLVVASASPWRWNDLLFLLTLCEDGASVRFLFTAPSEKDFKRVVKGAGVGGHLLPYIADPLKPLEARETLQAVLSPVLPENKARKRRPVLKMPSVAGIMRGRKI